MDERATCYRFSKRGLFLFALACSLLLFEWKMWGVASLLETLTTLACGAALAWFFATRPIHNRKIITAGCVLLTLANFIGLIVFENSWPDYGYIVGSRIGIDNEYVWLAIYLVSLLIVTSLITGMLRLIAEPRWSLLFPVLIAFNLWFGRWLIHEMLRPYYGDVSTGVGSNLIRGYTTAMAVFGLALVLRWVKALPTTRDELEL